jgi:two-component system, cell cycle sensor histidine kinase and response regulator CckA
MPVKPHDGPSTVCGAERILVVDDEAPVRKVVCLMLERLGYRVLEATNGAEAVGILETSRVRIDLILTDLVMPELHGGELGEFVAGGVPPRRVLYMTGYANEEIMRRGLVHADTPLLKKPFSPDALGRAVRDVLDRSGSRTTTP